MILTAGLHVVRHCRRWSKTRKMRSAARRPQTGALLVDNTVNDEMKKGVSAIYAGNGVQSDTRFSCVAGATGTMPQHDHGTEGGFSPAPWHRGSGPSVWAPARMLVDAVRADIVPTPALDAKAEGRRVRCWSSAGWTRSARMPATSMNQGC